MAGLSIVTGPLSDETDLSIFFFLLDENSVLTAEVIENIQTYLKRGSILQGAHNEMIV